jgi:hypothetical protein
MGGVGRVPVIEVAGGRAPPTGAKGTAGLARRSQAFAGRWPTPMVSFSSGAAARRRAHRSAGPAAEHVAGQPA